MTTVTQDLPINEGYISHSKVIRIKDIKLGDRIRKDLGDYQSLAESIREVGLLQPPVVNEDNELICGARRLEACAEILHCKEIPVTVVPLVDILKGEFHENYHRKSFTTTETIEIKHVLEKRVLAEAKKRQGQRNDISLKSTESWDESEPHDTRDKVAGYFGIGWKKLDQLEDVVNAAKGNPEKFGDLPTKIDKGMKVNTAWKRIQDDKTKQKARNQKSTQEHEEQFFIRKKEITLGKCIELLDEYPNRKAEIAEFLVEGIEKEMSA